MLEEPKIPQEIDPKEFLYRGVVEHQWDEQNNRPSSAVFKDSKGVSVNRDALILDTQKSVGALLDSKPFKAICRIKAGSVRDNGALSKYLPVPGNDYHCEIHDSDERVPLTAGKARRLRDSSEVVFLATIV